MNLPPAIQSIVHDFLQTPVLSAQSITGGCIHQAFKLQTLRGPYFLKFNDLAQAGNLQVERKGLDLLREVGTLKIPQVFQQGETEKHTYLLLEWIERKPQATDFWEQLGMGLAHLHQHTRPQYGLEYDNYIGALSQSNASADTWDDFFIAQRIHPLVKSAQDKGYLPAETQRKFESFLKRVPELFPEERPALIHGDLWGGNLLSGTQGEPALIDPAVYYGHREAELAFMTLFDQQPDIFYRAYETVWPLVPDFPTRVKYYNLYPLLVHLNLFGTSYLSGIEQGLKGF